RSIIIFCFIFFNAETPKVDDGGSPEIPLLVTFPYFAVGQRSLYVNNNGVISFNVQVSQFTPEAFPLSDGRSFMAPFWADVHNGIRGTVYFRESSEPHILRRVTRDISRNFRDQASFSATWVFIATWHQVTFYGGSSTTPVNTFQCILVTDGRVSFAMFNYAEIHWTTGTASGGDPLTGVGGSAAQVGFNGGDNSHFFSLPSSRTSEVLNMEQTSNVNMPGRWLFRIDGVTIAPARGCSRFHRHGDIFWIDEKCQTKCRCLDLGNIHCQNLSCSQFEQCQAVEGGYHCVPSQVASCVVFGDPHYHTFDGLLFHFQGTCSYILAKPCWDQENLPGFSIESRNENRVGTSVSWLQTIKLDVYSHSIRIPRGNSGHILVNGAIATLPVQLENSRIKVYRSGLATAIETDFGLLVTFDGQHYASISLPSSYLNNTCGLCGNFNNDPQDDTFLPDGTSPDSLGELGRVWQTEDLDWTCSNGCSENCTFCDPQTEAFYYMPDYCGIMNKSDGPFRDCRNVVDATSFMISCVYDMCSNRDNITTLCQAIQAYALTCQALGIVIGPWRSRTFCGKTLPCPEWSHYEVCASSCPASCSSLVAPLYCNRPCTEACECDMNYVLSGDICVPLEECGCEARGRYYPFKATFWATEECTKHCVCEADGEVMCVNRTCAEGDSCLVENGIRGCYPKRVSVCIINQNNILQSFDGVVFEFRDEYAYTLLKTCSSNSYNLSHFEIKLGRKKIGSSSWVKPLSIKLPEHEIKLGGSEHNIIKVNGFTVSLPFTHSSGKLKLFRNGNNTVVESENNFKILYSRLRRVDVALSTAYYNSTCGLCGYFNGNPSDDFRKANGKQTEHVAEFVDSWKTFADDLTCNGECEELYTLCAGEELLLYQGSSLCGIINDPNNSSFLNCHNVVNPSPFFRSCLYTMCLNGGNRTALCSSLQAYADTCIGAEVSLLQWRSSTFCPIPCPQNSHFSECTTGCPATCSALGAERDCPLPCAEGCQCHEGFALKDGLCVPRSECGCIHGGRHLSANETLWLEKECQVRCYCNGSDNTVTCEAVPCRGDEHCLRVGGVYVCEPRTHAVCINSGYGHYYTFDAFAFDLHSTCSHIVSTLCTDSGDIPNFIIKARYEDRNTSLALWLQEVELRLYDYNITAAKSYKHTVMINNERLYLPLTLGPGKVNLSSFGLYLVMETDFGLKVMYDWNTFLSITIPRSLYNSTCGLCGQFNGNPADELQTADAKITTNLKEYIESWVVGSELFCEVGCDRLCPACHKVHTLSFDTLQLCALIVSKDEVFRSCHSKVKPGFFYHNCIFDSCIDGGNRQTACNWLQNYASTCQAQGILVQGWRNLTSCLISCPVDSHYVSCMSVCQPRCTTLKPQRDCNHYCVEGCQCNNGFVLNGGSCILPQDCGCVVDNKYYQHGQFFWNDNCSKHCRCIGRNMIQCDSRQCKVEEVCGLRSGVRGCYSNKRSYCIAAGGGIFQTFDGAFLRFPAACSFVLSTICYKLPDTSFQLIANFDKWSSPNMTVISPVYLYVNEEQILISGNIVQVNGTQVSIPVVTGLSTKISRSEGFLIIDTLQDIQIRYNGFNLLSITMGERLRNKVCGLCGNFNGNPHDDDLTSLGKSAQNVIELAKSWKTNGMQHSCDEEHYLTLSLSCNNLEIHKLQKEGYCPKLTDMKGFFQPCHGIINPLPFYQSCGLDGCYLDEQTQDSGWDTSTPPPFMEGDIVQADVVCTASLMEVSISKCRLYQLGFEREDVRINDVHCPRTDGDNFIAFQINNTNGNCGNIVKTNETHIMYTNTVWIESLNNTGSVITRDRVINVEFSCAYELDLKISLETVIKPMLSVVNLTLPTKEGNFITKMALYKNSSYKFPYREGEVTLTTRDVLYIGVFVEGADSTQLILIISRCWATPSRDPKDRLRYVIIERGCPNGKDSTITMEENGVSLTCRFHIIVFKFIGDYEEVHLHCDVTLCDADINSCGVVCPHGTRFLASHTRQRPNQQILSVGPIRRKAADWCQDGNGGCEQICSSDPRGPVCSCVTGSLQRDRKNCRAFNGSSLPPVLSYVLVTTQLAGWLLVHRQNLKMD
uniref:Tectorin alpha n=1 Tax=Callorhinchus milii TaxID=7868 RepID=A0A4W3GVP4_CALMI